MLSREGTPRPGRGLVAREAGVTVVELLVVVLLLSVVGGTVTTTLVGGMRTSRVLQERTEALSQLELTAGRAARQLRAAAPVEQVAMGPNEAVQIRTFSQGTCSRYTYRVEGAQLVQYQEVLSPAPPPEGAFPDPSACASPAPVLPPPAAANRRVLIDGLAPGQVFVYRRAADNAVMDFTTTPLPSEQDIGSITMTLRREIRDGGTVEVATDILLRNQR